MFSISSSDFITLILLMLIQCDVHVHINEVDVFACIKCIFQHTIILLLVFAKCLPLMDSVHLGVLEILHCEEGEDLVLHIVAHLDQGEPLEVLVIAKCLHQLELS